MALEDDIQIESASEALRREYINQKKEDQAELEAMGRWGSRRRMFHKESTWRRSSPPS